MNPAEKKLVATGKRFAYRSNSKACEDMLQKAYPNRFKDFTEHDRNYFEQLNVIVESMQYDTHDDEIEMHTWLFIDLCLFDDQEDLLAFMLEYACGAEIVTWDPHDILSILFFDFPHTSTAIAEDENYDEPGAYDKLLTLFRQNA